MPLYRIEHLDKPSTVIEAGALIVHEGYLHATPHHNSFEPGRSETLASWAPGAWVSFDRAPECPTCKRQMRDL